MVSSKIIIIVSSLLALALAVGLYLYLKRKPNREGLLYLKQYELQDQYRNKPDIWPVTYNGITAYFKNERDAIEKELADRGYDNPR